MADLRNLDAHAHGGSRDSLYSNSGPSSLPLPLASAAPVPCVPQRSSAFRPITPSGASGVKAAFGRDDDQCQSLDERTLQSMQTDQNRVEFGLHEMGCVFHFFI